MKKIGLIIFSVLVIGAFVFIYLFKGKEFVHRIPEAKLITIMEDKLPITKTYLFIIDVTLSNPRVDLLEGSSRLNAGLDVELNIKIKGSEENLRGKVDLSGSIQYESVTGEFFLIAPVVEKVSIQGIPDKLANKANNAISVALSSFYEKYPVYTLRSRDAKTATAKFLLKSVIVENEELVITLGL